MSFQPKPEPGCPPFSCSTTIENLDEMSIFQLVWILRQSFFKHQFDSVEKVLEARDQSLKAEIASLKEMVEVERREKLQAEEEVRKREEMCQEGKKARELYENLLKEVKISNNGLVDRNAVKELRDENDELSAENYKLRKLRKQWLDDSVAVGDLIVKVGNLEGELEVSKKNHEDDKIALNELRRRNDELEEVFKSEKCAVNELKAENKRLLNDNRRLVALAKSKEEKYLELNDMLKEIEDNVRLLKMEEEEELDEKDARGCNAGSDTLQRNGNSLGAGIVQCESKVNKDAQGASGKEILCFASIVAIDVTGRSGLEPDDLIVISDEDGDDNDNDDHTHNRQHIRFSTKRLTRKISVPDISSSSSDTASNCSKKRKRG
ncbi:hypothetical protein RIF29_18083 [Crotalaria pallida]|uniref:Uncharacterized protein n=1 Tax=Crotalaria pallida TaxID=3830 RepID=A0AAN9FJR2_CROPI